MYYSFSAERKIAFVVSAGGVRRLVEFGDRNENGTSTFVTQDRKVAIAIRKHSMSRRGVIVETTPNLDEEPVPEAPKPQPRSLAVVKGVVKGVVKQPKAGKPATAKTNVEQKQDTDGKVREYANFTVAKEAICKEFGIPKSSVRNPTALSKVAASNGFTIKYTSAEK
jgi:hypothetical protein